MEDFPMSFDFMSVKLTIDSDGRWWINVDDEMTAMHISHLLPDHVRIDYNGMAKEFTPFWARADPHLLNALATTRRQGKRKEWIDWSIEHVGSLPAFEAGGASAA